MRTYPRKDAEGKDGTVEFKNVNSGDLGLETEDEKKAAEEATTANKALFDAMRTLWTARSRRSSLHPPEGPPRLPVRRRPAVHRDGEGAVQAARQ